VTKLKQQERIAKFMKGSKSYQDGKGKTICELSKKNIGSFLIKKIKSQ